MQFPDYGKRKEGRVSGRRVLFLSPISLISLSATHLPLSDILLSLSPTMVGDKESEEDICLVMERREFLL